MGLKLAEVRAVSSFEEREGTKTEGRGGSERSDSGGKWDRGLLILDSLVVAGCRWCLQHL